MELRDYQKEISQQAKIILEKYKIVYLAMQVRTGKTLTALETVYLCNFQKCLFVTKLKAIKSIESDYNNGNYFFKLTVINYESVAKVGNDFDVIIIDEAHSLGAYPKPSIRTKTLKKICENKPIIYLSGTPSPESYSQLYHQFFISSYSPFSSFVNFYKFAKEYITVKKMMFKGLTINNYSNCNKEMVDIETKHLFLNYTQKQAGFVSEIVEKTMFVDCNPNLEILKNILLKDRYYKFKNGDEIVCDTPASLQNKIHQIDSGTVITETGTTILCDAKAVEIHRVYQRNKSQNQMYKIAIFYKFVAEGEVLKSKFPNWTDSPEQYQKDKNKVFLCQIQSGARGIDLSTADVLYFYNIDFSAETYWQARARLQHITKAESRVVWVFNRLGIESKIYQAVQKKKSYTTSYFKKDYQC